MSERKLPWFRMYSEAVDDEKLRLLAFEDRWHFVALMCCKNAGILDSDDQLLRRKVAVKLGLASRELDEVARRLSEVGLIDYETMQPLAWDDRQMISDTSAARTKAYRERMKRHCDVTVTAQDTDTDKELKYSCDLLSQTTPASKEKTLACPHAEILEHFHEALPTLPQVRIFTEKRKQHLQARWRERMQAGKYSTKEEGIAYWRRFFDYVGTSDFLMGRNADWRCDFEWLINSTNFAKVAEGNYHKDQQ